MIPLSLSVGYMVVISLSDVMLWKGAMVTFLVIWFDVSWLLYGSGVVGRGVKMFGVDMTPLRPDWLYTFTLSRPEISMTSQTTQ